MYNLQLSDEAIADYEAAVAWYEEQKTGLGFDFSVRLAETFEKIEAYPTAQRFLYENRRFAFVKQFPFIVYFVLDEDNLRVVVFAILHEKRDPEIWRTRSRGMG